MKKYQPTGLLRDELLSAQTILKRNQHATTGDTTMNTIKQLGIRRDFTISEANEWYKYMQEQPDHKIRILAFGEESEKDGTSFYITTYELEIPNLENRQSTQNLFQKDRSQYFVIQRNEVLQALGGVIWAWCDDVDERYPTPTFTQQSVHEHEKDIS